jgi:release factor glutamine methyltransferase
MLAVDINRDAAVATRRTATASGISIDVVQGDLASPLLPRLAGAVDVLIFNPPYVPTPPEEVGTQ